MFTPLKLLQLQPKHLLFENYSIENFKLTEPIKAISTLALPSMPVLAYTTFILSTLVLVYFHRKNENKLENSQTQKFRSTQLPGWGILGDRVNELIEIFLDTLAVYVHNDNKWNNCPQRLLCEANQRAVDYGTFYGVLTYLSSLFVSFWLQNRRVTSSMEAMRKGRQGQNCIQQYPCPFSL